MAADSQTLKFALEIARAVQNAADALPARSVRPTASEFGRSTHSVQHADSEDQPVPAATTAKPVRPEPPAKRNDAAETCDTSDGRSAPSAFISWAHRHATWNSEKERDWQAQVANLAISMRRLGIDADLDLFHLDDPGVDWTRFGPRGVRDNEHVLIVISQAWTERWNGDNPPHEGAGAVAEADELRGMFSTNQTEFQRRCFIIQLPDVSGSEIPHGLNRLPRYTIDVDDPDSYDPLLRALTGQPRYPKPPLGDVPVLPAEVLGQSLADVDEALVALKQRLHQPKARGTRRDFKSMLDSSTRGFIEALLQEHGDRLLSDLEPVTRSR